MLLNAALEKERYAVRQGFITKLISNNKNIEEKKATLKAPSLGRVDFAKCPRFGLCSAPICPLDPNRQKAIWYPDEEICKNREMAKQFKFIQVQRKIQKRAKDRETYYTLELLEKIKIVRSGIRGYTPERSHAK